ncbi:MAG: hypothetical protein O2962_08295, partial [Cyanobacteria bacterium]|nr:hypothetical protein [Cyanobacteriota bacterium]
GDTQIPGQNETARNISAVSQKANVMTQLGKTIGKFIEDAIIGLGKLFEKATASNKDQKPKDTQHAQNEPQPEPPADSESSTESET